MHRRNFLIAVTLAIAFSPAAFAQDAAAWLEAQGLVAIDTKSFEDLEAIVARDKTPAPPPATPTPLVPNVPDERVVIMKQGKPVWQSNPKENEPGSRWTLRSMGPDLDGDGHPDLYFTNNTGGPNCCTTHYVYRLKPQVRRLAAYSAGAVGGGEFVQVPGRKAALMISADDSSANAFAPYANSYFPMIVLEVGNKGRLEFAFDLMQSRLPGQPPPVCALALAKSNLWLKERCAEYASARRQERTARIKSKLAELKSGRSGDRLGWDDYFANGVLAAVSAEMNRYTYTGHGNAGLNWLETVWPGNDAVKVKFLTTLRMTQAKSAFAPDLRTLASDNR